MELIDKLIDLADDTGNIRFIEEFLKELENGHAKISSYGLSQLIGKLNRAKKVLVKQEEAQRQAEEEALRQKQLEEEASKARLEAAVCMDLPLDWENAFIDDERALGVHADSIPDGLVHSLTALGRVDIEYIAQITGEDCKTVVTTLKGSIYQNPDKWEECFYKGWETVEEYLSGNLMRKWKVAEEASRRYDGYFDENLRAIERVLPPSVATKDIYVTLGSPWVPVDMIDDFITYILGRHEPGVRTQHDEVTGTWEITNKSCVSHYVRVTTTYGTPKIGALHILEKTLNMKAVAVTDEVFCPTNKSGKKRVINQDETVLALEKQKKMIDCFQKWVWEDQVRSERLQKIFEDNFSSVRRRIFDGSFLTFPTMAEGITLYPYQKNAVARILFSPNTLLAHDVGAGKTYVMIAAAMELRRMGLSKKNLFVVPNNIVGQWKETFEMLYSSAKLLVVEPKDFTPTKRERALEAIRDGDWDGIIMAYSSFEQIPLSKAYYRQELEEKLRTINEIASQSGKATSRLTKKQQKLKEALAELELALDDTYDTVYFDELGITRLFVDEAHNFKNLPIETKIDKVLGISKSGSEKCQDMLDKVHLVQRQNDGGGVVMATGTPITNSITDIFAMQLYLQSGELALLDLQNFDSWVGMFAERRTEFEIDVDTSSYRLATRFSKFHNLPELTAMVSSIADFHAVDGDGLPAFEGYTDALIGKTSEFADYLSDISKRAEDVRHSVVPRTEDNMLMITTDGRKAALDLRLVDQKASFTYQSKVARCAEQVVDIYMKTHSERSTQIIFCDSSTPKAGFNLYDELTRLLVGYDMDASKIAYIHDADSKKKRAKLFAAMRAGEIRVLIGSTFKLGLGVNVQDKLIAIHHLDVPWRPADMTQREGRILRQGNQNSRVYIYRYITEGSFDAYSWQLLETKQRFITELLSGSLTDRSGSDVDDTVLDYAEVKALAVGNPLVKERVETANELSRFLTLQHKTVEHRLHLESTLAKLPAQIEAQRSTIEKCRADMAFYNSTRRIYSKQEEKAIAETRRNLRTVLHDAVRANVLSPRERKLFDYEGFSIILPANMDEKTPYVWLSREGAIMSSSAAPMSAI